MKRVPRRNLQVPDAEADLYIVGLGIGGFYRMTLETQDLLATAANVLHLTAYDQELKRLCAGADVSDLKEIYEASDNPWAVYESISRRVINAALGSRDDGHTCFLTYGHPTFLVDSSFSLLAQSEVTGLRIKAIPAVSSFDTIQIDTPIRIDRACQIFEATQYYRLKVQVDTRFPLLLTQFGDFASDQLRPLPGDGARFQPLFDRVKEQFPGRAKAYLTFSAWRHDMEPTLVPRTVDSIEELAEYAHVGTSLVIEGVR